MNFARRVSLPSFLHSKRALTTPKTKTLTDDALTTPNPHSAPNVKVKHREGLYKWSYWRDMKAAVKREIRYNTLMFLPYTYRVPKRLPFMGDLVSYRFQRKQYFSRLQNTPKQVWLAMLSGRPKTFSSEFFPVTASLSREAHEPGRSENPPTPQTGNFEMLKVPCFLNLTKEIVARQCEELKKHFVPYPENLPHMPLSKHYTTKVYAGNAPPKSGTNVFKVSVYLDDLKLDELQKKKLLIIAGTSYNEVLNRLTVTASECPARHQNHDFAMYRLMAFVNEARNLTERDKKYLAVITEQDMDECMKVQFRYDDVERGLFRFENDASVVCFNSYGHPFADEARMHCSHEQVGLDDFVKADVNKIKSYTHYVPRAVERFAKLNTSKHSYGKIIKIIPAKEMNIK